MKFTLSMSSSVVKLKLPEYEKAWATIIPDYVWNKGTKYAHVVPNLSMVKVPDKKQGLGYGQKLFELVLNYMRTSNTPVIAFDNFNDGFWSAMARKYPNNVAFKDIRGKPRAFGIIRLDASTKPDSVFNR